MKVFIYENWYNLITSIIAVLGLFGAAYQYFDKKKWEQRWKESEYYHNLVKKLSNIDMQQSLNEQMAIVHELMFFKRYYKITLHILINQKQSWEGRDSNKGLINEMSLVIEKLEKKTTKWRKILSCC